MHAPGPAWTDWDAVAPIRATAALPLLDWDTAVARIDAEDPVDGVIQLCPQNGARARLAMDVEQVERLRQRYPQRRFRLHANHRLARLPALFYDASTVDRHWSSCFAPLAALHRRLGADVYSLHAGRADYADRAALVRGVARLEQLFAGPVAVEGMYPSQRERFHVDSSEGYRWLLQSGLAMAIDVSHVHIVRTQEGGFDEGLLDALLQSERCVEVHLSHNDGRLDQHRSLPVEPPWWWPAVRRARAVRPDLAVLCESLAVARPAEGRPVML